MASTLHMVFLAFFGYQFLTQSEVLGLSLSFKGLSYWISKISKTFSFGSKVKDVRMLLFWESPGLTLILSVLRFLSCAPNFYKFAFHVVPLRVKLVTLSSMNSSFFCTWSILRFSTSNLESSGISLCTNSQSWNSIAFIGIANLLLNSSGNSVHILRFPKVTYWDL